LSRSEFRDLFPAEGELIEFKSGTGERPIQASSVAFSNADGGVILIGVQDDGTVVGRPLNSGTADAVHQALSATNDIGRYELHGLDIDGIPITVIAVARREDGFAQTSNGRVLVRRGSRDEALFGSDLQRFINERAHRRFEETPTVEISDAQPELFARLANAYGWSDHERSGDRLRSQGFAVEARLTVAGALYLTADPAQVLGKAYVEILRFGDETTTDYDRRDELRGPLTEQLEASVARISDLLGTELVVLGVRRYELPRIPEVVLRECIANALAHRSYESAGTAVRIELRPASVRVISPGGLPEPVTVRNIREVSAARNLHVIRALRRFGLAEDAGRGVRVMEEAMRSEMLEPPDFIDHRHSVEVVLPVRSAVAPVERAWVRELEARGSLGAGDRLVLVHAARGEALTNARVREILQTDAQEARAVLHRLRDAGLLLQHGQRGGASYTLDGSLHPPAGLRLAPAQLDDLVAGLSDEGPISNADVRRATGLDRAESLAVLDRLVRAGRLRRFGQRRGTRYERP
jgi:ATP-dependent DNA helicase RecG